ncbi:MAG: hypothetical protein KGL39_42345 [Patescibacteria group bacterium]|nr:hypothetical protein [Patescibacteria group bacterium]
MSRPEILRHIGAVLYGPDWQRALARALGEFHPGGPRRWIDDRLVRRWASYERPVPDWVGPAVATLLERHDGELRSARGALEKWHAE